MIQIIHHKIYLIKYVDQLVDGGVHALHGLRRQLEVKLVEEIQRAEVGAGVFEHVGGEDLVVGLAGRFVRDLPDVLDVGKSVGVFEGVAVIIQEGGLIAGEPEADHAAGDPDVSEAVRRAVDLSAGAADQRNDHQEREDQGEDSFYQSFHFKRSLSFRPEAVHCVYYTTNGRFCLLSRVF